MRLNVVLVLAAVVSTVSATPDTNAQRLARGLPPLPPVRRATRVAGMSPYPLFRELSVIIPKVAKKSRPSSSHDGCNTGSLYCCMYNNIVLLPREILNSASKATRSTLFKILTLPQSFRGCMVSRFPSTFLLGLLARPSRLGILRGGYMS